MSLGKILVLPAGLLAAGAAVWMIALRGPAEDSGTESPRPEGPTPVEIAPITRGPIALRRMFSGTLEARSELVVAPKVGGRVERLHVQLSDTVRQDQLVAELDDDEFVQALRQAEAELAVAKARVTEGESALETADRELERAQTLRGQGIVSEAHLDTARASRLSKFAALEVARAQRARSEAALESARIRLGYTRVVASWTGDETARVVAARYVDEGGTVAANTPLMSIVSLDPIVASVFATEKDYGRLSPGQPATLTTDAFPGRSFPARVARIAPVFREASRQARVEFDADNGGSILKPGMFVRVEVVLDRVDEAAIVPVESVVTRDGRTGLFVVDGEGGAVTWRPVQTGIEEHGRVQVEGEGIAGRVVTLGQQHLQDGSRIAIVGGDRRPQAGPGTPP